MQSAKLNRTKQLHRINEQGGRKKEKKKKRRKERKRKEEGRKKCKGRPID